MKIKFFGAAGSVSGSRMLISYQGVQGLVDCGLFQGPRELREHNWAPFPDVEKIKFVILTHAHIDHSGYLPRLVQMGFKGPIYCSEGTRDLARVLLLDAAYLQEEDAQYANRTRHSRHVPALPLYTEKDALAAIELLQVVPLKAWTQLSPDWSFQFLRAGHILGSCLVQVSLASQQGAKIVSFTGDLGNGRSQVIKGPESVLETDYLITESTYGDRVQPAVDQLAVLESVVNKVIGRHGTLVIPAFAVGRTQELLYLLHQLKKQNKIPRVPVYLDSPMANKATDIYLHHFDELLGTCDNQDVQESLGPSNLKPVKDFVDSQKLSESSEPKIVISASGMLQGGRVLHHLKAKLPDAKNGVLFVGYQGVGTKGSLLKNGLDKIRIHHELINVKAEIFSMDSLSAHADSNELMAWISNIKTPPFLTLISHGEPASAEALAYRIRTELNWKASVPKMGEEFTLV